MGRWPTAAAAMFRTYPPQLMATCRPDGGVPQNRRCRLISALLEGNNEQFEALTFVFESGATKNPDDIGRGVLIEPGGLNSLYGAPEEVEHKI